MKSFLSGCNGCEKFRDKSCELVKTYTSAREDIHDRHTESTTTLRASATKLLDTKVILGGFYENADHLLARANPSELQYAADEADHVAQKISEVGMYTEMPERMEELAFATAAVARCPLRPENAA